VYALVTTDAAAAVDPDLAPLHVALRNRLGDDVATVVSWDDSRVDWSTFDAVIIRSTWDYVDRLGEFLAWTDRVASVTLLLNSADTIRWSASKEYLVELADEGIPIVPTVLVRPGDTVPSVVGLHVVKPTVGAGSKGARRCEPHEVEAHVAVLHAEGRTAMIQPYLDLLDERGELEHCFVPATGSSHSLALSHVFRKGAILTSTTVEQVHGLFAKEEITAAEPTTESLQLAQAVLATDAIQRLGEIAFARIDVAPFRAADQTESLVVMEVELIEPSFYFDVTPGSAEVFADRLIQRLTSPAGVTAAQANGLVGDACAEVGLRVSSKVGPETSFRISPRVSSEVSSGISTGIRAGVRAANSEEIT
jgi:hypothetical protein